MLFVSRLERKGKPVAFIPLEWRFMDPISYLWIAQEFAQEFALLQGIAKKK